VGDVFLVPQQDGRCSLGQVLAFEKQMMNSVSCAFYDIRFPSADGIQLPSDLPSASIIAVLFTTHDLLRRGAWNIVGRLPVVLEQRYFPYEHLRGSGGWVGATMHGSGIVVEFLDAYFGLRFWDDWYDPEYLDELLFQGRQRPPGIKLMGKKKPIKTVQPTAGRSAPSGG